MPSSPSPPAAPYRVSRLVETSSNFDNLTNSNFYQLAGELKPSVFKGDNHFVHELCLNTNESARDQLSSSRDSFLDGSNQSPSSGSSTAKQESPERPHDENKVADPLSPLQAESTEQIVVAHATIDESVEMIDASPHLPTASENPPEIDERPLEPENDEDILERENELDERAFQFTSDPAAEDVYDYPNPFSDEYDQVIAAQPALATLNGSNEPNLRELYRDHKIRPDLDPNVRGVFEKCVKLAR